MIKPKFITFMIIIIILLIGLIAVLFNVKKESIPLAQETIKTFEIVITQFYAEYHRYPDQCEGLDVLLKYFKDIDNIPIDPWGNPYYYLIPGPDHKPYGIICFGADGKPGGTGKNKDYFTW